jgi:hypothetical protein
MSTHVASSAYSSAINILRDLDVRSSPNADVVLKIVLLVSLEAAHRDHA